MRDYVLNPFLPEYEYIPDGEPHVFDGRVYIYGSHDRFNGSTFCMNNYICYSADCNNLKEWRYEGVIFDKLEDPRCREQESELWAPDVVRGKDGRFYLYYCPNPTPGIGVAVCDTPAGEYKYLGLVHDKDGNIIPGFDPAAILDDDGTCYLYSGGGPLFPGETREDAGSWVYTMEEDMLTVREVVRSSIGVLGDSEGTSYEGHEFFEASSIRKIKGKYYFIYSSRHLHELCYAVSDRPNGGFEYGGVIVSNVDIMEHSDEKIAKNCIGNNHGSVECINGKYYIFYHRQTNGTMFSRQACAEEIEITEDGKILQARISSCGLNGGPLPGSGTYPASCVCLLYGNTPHQILWDDQKPQYPHITQDKPEFDMEDYAAADKDTLPRQFISNAQDGTHAVFRYFDIKNLSKIKAVVRGTASGKLIVNAGENQTKIAEICIEPSEDWKEFSAEASVADGVYELDFHYQGNGALQLLEFCLETK